MATYYSSPNNQRENAPILYSRELPTSFAEASVLPPNMLIYMNSDSYSDAAMAVSSQQPSNCIDMPSMAASQHQQNILSNLGGSRTGENDFSEWRDSSKTDLVVTHAMTGAPSFVHGGQGLQGQGLSLSLGTQIPSGISFRNPNMGFASFLSPNVSNSRDELPRNVEYLPHQDSNKGEMSPYAMSSVARAVPSSKYLKVAQQLLDEVVNVRKALKQNDGEKAVEQRLTSPKEGDDGSKSESTPGGVDSGGNSQPELSHAEKQELQNKLTKLLSMLDEVDRRYKQYYHQMQIVVSSFDAIAGCGSAKPYTALALQTISRHFRCLRDAIAGQIKATRKSLGEEDAPGNIRGVGISRLRFVDQQLRQQRALQQLGMMQQHAWRPQRGLPESSVSILRAWLFEHFLHPYPKDSDKIMLARQTGLTRSQVSNWFINARVRLWKPMVEEMYKEETGDADMDSNSSSETAGKQSKGDAPASADRREDPQQQSASSTGTSLVDNAKTDHLAPDVEMPGPDYESMMRRSEEHHRRPAPTHEYGLYPDAIAAYQMSELGRFGGGGGVSLTLGLQHCDGVVPMAHGTHQHQHGFVADDGMYGGGNAPEGTDFDSQPRFASASHLLHDFVV